MTRATPTSNMIDGRIKLKVDKPFTPWPLLTRPCMEANDTNRQSVGFISSVASPSLSFILYKQFSAVLSNA